MLAQTAGESGRRFELDAQSDADVVRVEDEFGRCPGQEVSGDTEHRFGSLEDDRSDVVRCIANDSDQHPGGDLERLDETLGVASSPIVRSLPTNG